MTDDDNIYWNYNVFCIKEHRSFKKNIKYKCHFNNDSYYSILDNDNNIWTFNNTFKEYFITLKNLRNEKIKKLN